MENRSGVNRRMSRSLVWARKQNGWSQRVLAERAGVSVDTVQKLEAGRLSVTLAKVERIADALQVEVATLFGERDGTVPIAGWLGLRKVERALVVALVGYFAARGRRIDELREGGS